MTAAGAIGVPSPRHAGLRRAARVVFFVLGLGLAAWLVRSAGVSQVLAVLNHALIWLPVVGLFEIAGAVTDALAAAVLLGSAAYAVPLSAWLRSSALAYASMILLPAGRATGEAARAAVLSGSVGAQRAAGACARLQACTLLANTVISVVGAAVIAGAGSGAVPLALALLANGAICAVIGGALFTLLRSGRVAQWLRARFARFAVNHVPAPHAPARRSASTIALGICSVGRVVQTCQFGVVMYAIGGAFTAPSGFVAQGIHLVGAAIGDVIPGQLGAREGSYRAFASTLGLGTDPARALSIPLVVRVAQLGVVAVCLLLAASVGRQARPLGEGR
jgi:hypothetical protein